MIFHIARIAFALTEPDLSYLQASPLLDMKAQASTIIKTVLGLFAGMPTVFLWSTKLGDYQITGYQV